MRIGSFTTILFLFLCFTSCGGDSTSTPINHDPNPNPPINDNPQIDNPVNDNPDPIDDPQPDEPEPDIPIFVPLSGVPVSSYRPPVSLGFSFGTNGYAEREILFYGHQLRIRQDGTIIGVKFFINSIESTTDFHIVIWRKSEHGFDRIGESENLAPKLTANSMNEIGLAHPIAGVREGDYYGIRISQAGKSAIKQLVLSQSLANCSTHFFNSRVGDNSVPFDSSPDKILNDSTALSINLYMDSPQFVAIGDSLVAGHYEHYSFIEEKEVTDISASWPYMISKTLGLTYQNMGKGGNRIVEVEKRIVSDAISLKPHTIVALCGVNDLINFTETDKYLTSWANILKAAEEHGIQMIVIGILPWTNGSNKQMQKRDSWNKSLREMVESYDGFIYIDADSYVGKFRPNGDTGNLWDIRDGFTDDGIHYLKAGNEKIAEAVLDSLPFPK